MVGDSFIHPVKKFNVEKDGDIVVLQFEVSREKQEGKDSKYVYLSLLNSLVLP